MKTFTFYTLKDLLITTSVIASQFISTSIVTAQSPSELELLKYVNQARSSAGAAPLCLNQKLHEVAKAQSQHLTVDLGGKFDKNTAHVGPGNTDIGTRATQKGFQYLMVGENVASPMGAKGAFDAWMNSPGHRANILNRDFKFMGAFGSNGDVWVQVFGNSGSEQCLAAGNKAPGPAQPSKTPRFVEHSVPAPPPKSSQALAIRPQSAKVPIPIDLNPPGSQRQAQPQSGGYGSATGYGSPPPENNQNCNCTETPPVAEVKKCRIRKQPASGNSVPSTNTSVPAYGNNAPAYGNNAPAYGNNTPAYGNNAPA